MWLTDSQQHDLDVFWNERERPNEASDYNHISNAVLKGDYQEAEERYCQWKDKLNEK